MVKKIKGPLDGMVVIELAHIMAGAVCGLLFSDLRPNKLGGTVTERSVQDREQQL